MEKLTPEEKTLLSNFLTNLKSTSDAFNAFSLQLDTLITKKDMTENDINGDVLSKLYLTDTLGVNAFKNDITRLDTGRIYDSYERMYNLIQIEKTICQP